MEDIKSERDRQPLGEAIDQILAQAEQASREAQERSSMDKFRSGPFIVIDAALKIMEETGERMGGTAKEALGKATDKLNKMAGKTEDSKDPFFPEENK